ncbi:hypothetical protein DSECCO2_574380 [anaerobic digester metagenome]
MPVSTSPTAKPCVANAAGMSSPCPAPSPAPESGPSHHVYGAPCPPKNDRTAATVSASGTPPPYPKALLKVSEATPAYTARTSDRSSSAGCSGWMARSGGIGMTAPSGQSAISPPFTSATCAASRVARLSSMQRCISRIFIAVPMVHSASSCPAKSKRPAPVAGSRSQNSRAAAGAAPTSCRAPWPRRTSWRRCRTSSPCS